MLRTYSSKVLLFGEYTVIDGSAAVAVPFSRYSGEWKYEQSNDQEGLLQLKNYLTQLYAQNKIDGIDFDQLERDLSNGLTFQSEIPIGYGLGSSGALVAAFFDRYMSTTRYSLSELRRQLAQIENCFHGKSSGIDPLVSYLNTPILSHPNKEIELIAATEDIFSKIVLIDTGIARQTAPLVEAYKETQRKSAAFTKATKDLAEITDDLISAYTLNDESLMVQSFKTLSSMQLEILPMLIPSNYQELWQQGLDSDSFYMKLCGAGGGGFLMCYVVDTVETKGKFETFGVKQISLIS